MRVDEHERAITEINNPEEEETYQEQSAENNSDTEGSEVQMEVDCAVDFEELATALSDETKK